MIYFLSIARQWNHFQKLILKIRIKWKRTFLRKSFSGGSGWIRTTEVTDNRFTVCPLWPLGNAPICEVFYLSRSVALATGISISYCFLFVNSFFEIFKIFFNICFCTKYTFNKLIFNTKQENFPLREGKTKNFFFVDEKKFHKNFFLLKKRNV